MNKKRQKILEDRKIIQSQVLEDTSVKKTEDDGLLSNDDLLILRQGLSLPFWSVLKKIIKANISGLSNEILDDSDPAEIVQVTNIDLAKTTLRINRWLLALPEKLTESPEDGSEKKDKKRFDPYPQTQKELKEIWQRMNPPIA